MEADDIKSSRTPQCLTRDSFFPFCTEDKKNAWNGPEQTFPNLLTIQLVLIKGGHNRIYSFLNFLLFRTGFLRFSPARSLVFYVLPELLPLTNSHIANVYTCPCVKPAAAKLGCCC